MAITIRNDYLIATIAEEGAELQSLTSVETNMDYVWHGDPEYWGKRAPILFPIVGAVKNDTYTFEGKTYNMPKHGLARISKFEVLNHRSDQASFILHSSVETKKHYPFDFEFIVHYKLIDKKLETQYEVVNKSTGEMFYSVGGHPAFNVPFEEGQRFEDYRLTFNNSEKMLTIPMVGNYTDLERKESLDNEIFHLNYEMFRNDVLVYQSKGYNEIALESNLSNHKLIMSYDGFLYVGLWTPNTKKSPFICIEPWAGLPDDVNASGKLEEKAGIEKISESDKKIHGFTIKVF